MIYTYSLRERYTMWIFLWLMPKKSRMVAFAFLNVPQTFKNAKAPTPGTLRDFHFEASHFDTHAYSIQPVAMLARKIPRFMRGIFLCS